MNRPSPRPSPIGWERVPGGRVRVPLRGSWSRCAVLFLALAWSCIPTLRAAEPSTSSLPPRLVEVSGTVEVAPGGGNDWRAAARFLPLHLGDRVRTGARSRATIQFSDRSVLRLGPSTLVELQAGQTAPAKRRFHLDLGRLFFLDRERPEDIEFETPLATGAIRGTEFALEAGENGGFTRLALLDGAVALRHAGGLLDLQGGQEVLLAPGRPPEVRGIVLAVNTVQWCLYYPAVLHVGELKLTAEERRTFGPSLEAWKAGAIRDALSLAPGSHGGEGPDLRVYRASLALATGGVDEAERVLDTLPPDHSLVIALRELIAAVRFTTFETVEPPQTASEWLARSYYLQSRARLEDALTAAREAVARAPAFGRGWERVAELEHDFERNRAAARALHRALDVSPRSAPAQALRGFIALAANRVTDAEDAFERALALDDSIGNAWLGRALVAEHRGQTGEARRLLQIAAALEPNRAELRSYLGKAWAEAGDTERAERELRLATKLDPRDPTPWLYLALEQHQTHQLNEAVHSMEHSLKLNDERAVFRSGLLLDRDRSVRSADLAAIYSAVGLDDPAFRLAARAVEMDAANFSAHLFVARALQEREDPFRADLRLETPRQSELLLANLLAPPGAGNLSQQLSQQDHLHYFGPKPVALSSLTEYGSGGDWTEAASVFGSGGGFGYALDSEFLARNGEQPNGDLARRQVSFQAKQRVGPDDEVYLQAGLLDAGFGDVLRHYDPAQADPNLRVEERQEPHLYAGWHHTWAPGSHTLLLASRLTDDLHLTDPDHPLLFLRRTDGAISELDSDRAVFDLRQDSAFTLNSVEVQHLWESTTQGFLVGSRYQAGSEDTDVTLNGPLPPAFAVQHVLNNLERLDAYGRYFWRPAPSLRFTAGLAYHHLRFPRNADLPPLSNDEDSRDLVAPVFAVTWSPVDRLFLRAAYSQSLGGLYFDDSIRLEPTQTAGFVQAFRSLVPESVAGLVPGTRFETAGAGVDYSLPGGLYTGLELRWMRSDGRRDVGAASNSLPFPLPDTPDSTLQALDFQERSVAVYLTQLLGRHWSAGLRYELTDSELATRFPEIPRTAVGLSSLEQDVSAVLHSLHLFLLFHHESGWFAEWHTEWRHQDNSGYAPGLAGDDVWQHHVFGGYRFPRRRAELRLGIMNLTGTDYRLNPLNLQEWLPRERTFTASLRLNF